MKKTLSLFALGLTLTLCVPFAAVAQDTPEPEPSPAAQDFQGLDARIRAKLSSGAQSPADFVEEVKEFDTLLAKYADDKSEDVARIAFMRASFIAQIMEDIPEAITSMKKIQTNFPGTEVATAAEQFLEYLEDQSLLANLVGNPAPELDFTWSTSESLTKLSDFRGKVVVLDFWATWCGPCVRSFPMVKELTDHYADSPVEVIGVTSLQGNIHGLGASPIDTKGDPDKEYSLMTDYIAAKDINWTIGFTSQPVFNQDYGISGIPHMAIIAPDGTLRHNDLHPAMPHAEKTALIDAILKEFNLK
jgi:thiol-disulfide isomerase/thioredoxin